LVPENEPANAQLGSRSRQLRVCPSSNAIHVVSRFSDL
jgi:hypothetical protein